MAYMSKGACPGGPYPNLAGEYCGNHCKGSRALAMFNETQQQADTAQRARLAKMRFGRPRPTSTYTTAELESMGMVGLYLKEDCKLFSWEEPCAAPLELMEPALDERKDGEA